MCPQSVAGASLVLILLLTPMSVLAQENEEIRHHGIFIDSVEVSLISLEVFASRDGEPVTDLTEEDFEILDDGQRVEISHFSQVDRRRPASTPADPVQATDSMADEIGQASGEPSTVIILVDQLFVSPLSRTRVFDSLSAKLEPLIDCGARIMVAAKTRDVSVEQDFTANLALVQSALDRLSEAPPPGYAAEIRTIVELWDLTPEATDSRQTGPGQPEPTLRTSEVDAQAAFLDARGLSQRLHADVSASLATLHRFLDSLAGLPGRKSLIYVADRLPVRPAEILWRIWWEKYGFEHGSKFSVNVTGPGELDLSRPLELLISDANAGRVAFYPVGTDSGPNLSGAASRGLTTPTRSVARTSESGSADGLNWLSERSGGRSAVGGRSFDAFFDEVARDLTTYYSIAYASPHAGDGEVHRLEVKVRRSGVDLRHPTEYRDKSADQRMTDRTLSALTLGAEVNALDVRVEVGKAKRKNKGLFAVPVEIRVPMANLVLLPDTTSHLGKLSIQLIARDPNGRFSDPVVVRMPFEVLHRDMSWALSQTVDYAAEMTVKGGKHTIAVGVHDDFGFAGSTVGVEVDVGGGK